MEFLESSPISNGISIWQLANQQPLGPPSVPNPVTSPCLHSSKAHVRHPAAPPLLVLAGDCWTVGRVF